MTVFLSSPPDVVGLSGTFFLYGTSSAAAALFFFFVLPETKGKTLEEIDRELRLNRQGEILGGPDADQRAEQPASLMFVQRLVRQVLPR